jgi:hypothetical protein
MARSKPAPQYLYRHWAASLKQHQSDLEAIIGAMQSNDGIDEEVIETMLDAIFALSQAELKLNSAALKASD